MKTLTQYLPNDNKKLWPIESQHPDIASPQDRRDSERYYLPELVKLWKDIERMGGYRWRCTSYWRKSPSHHKGIALDIAPDISQKSHSSYAVSNMSDPVLYKREKMLRMLQAVCSSHNTLNPKLSVGIFVEPDHLHLQVFERSELVTPCRLYKWKVAKPVYSDTYERMRLPIIKTK